MGQLETLAWARHAARHGGRRCGGSAGPSKAEKSGVVADPEIKKVATTLIVAINSIDANRRD